MLIIKHGNNYDDTQLSCVFEEKNNYVHAERTENV